MKVVVTGATGHLGGYLLAELLDAGHEVVAASRTGELPAPPFGRSVLQGSLRGLRIELRDEAAVAVLAAELGREVALVHLAAWHPTATASTGAAERNELLETNVHGTMRVLEAARRSRGGARVVVYASSFEVYGEVDTIVTEATRTNPLTDYGATKLAGEDHLLAFGYEEQTRVVALRMPAVYGPGEHTPRALPNFLRAVAKGERPTIFGDGADLRDQLHVRDAARALVLAVQTDATGIFNVADGESHAIRELACTALALANMPGEPLVAPRVKPRRDWHMSIEAARAALGFAPHVSLRDGMAEELAWLSQSL